MVVASEDDGGMAQVAGLLASGLPVFGIDTRVVVHREAPLTERLRAAGIPYDVVGELIETPTRPRADGRTGARGIVANLAGLPAAARRVAAIAREHDAAVLYSHSTWAHYTCASAAVKLRRESKAAPVASVWHVHNDHARPLTRLADRLAIRAAHVSAIVAVSHSIGRPFAGLSAASGPRAACSPAQADAAIAPLLTVVHNGIDLARAETASREPCLRAALGLAHDAVVAVYAGRLVAHKGIHVLLEAARTAMGSSPALHVAILGGNPRHEARDVIADMRARADSWGFGERLHLPGYVRDVERWVADADIAVVPSTCADGYPLAAIEALALGIPVIASSIGGLPEMVRDGVDGLLVPAGDAAALSRALVTLARHPEQRRRMSQAARASARARFDAARMTAGVAAILHRAAARAVASG